MKSLRTLTTAAAVVALAAGLTACGSHGSSGGSGDTVTLMGLPVTGFMAYNVINTNAQPGLLANYSGLFAHRASASCRSAGLGTSPGCPAIITSPPQ